MGVVEGGKERKEEGRQRRQWEERSEVGEGGESKRKSYCIPQVSVE